MKRKRLVLNPLPSSPVLQRLPFKIILMVISISINNVFIPCISWSINFKKYLFLSSMKDKEFSSLTQLPSFLFLSSSFSLLILCDYVLFFCRLPLYLKIICHQFYCIYLAVPHSLQYLSSPARDWDQGLVPEATTVKALNSNHWIIRELPSPSFFFFPSILGSSASFLFPYFTYNIV